MVFRNRVQGQHPGVGRPQSILVIALEGGGSGLRAAVLLPTSRTLSLLPHLLPSFVREVSFNCLLPREAVLHNECELGPKWGKSACPGKPSHVCRAERQDLGMWFHVLNRSDLWEDILESQVFIYIKTPSLHTCPLWVARVLKMGPVVLCFLVVSRGRIKWNSVLAGDSRCNEYACKWLLAAWGKKGCV